MINDKVNEDIEELLESLLNIYQTGLIVSKWILKNT